MYPNGDEERNGSNHISLYLVKAEDENATTSEVNVWFTFLVYDTLKDRYMTFQGNQTNS